MTSESAPTPVSLDDLYVMTAHMYSHRSEERPVAATLAHFVEVCAALTGMSRKKRRESLDIPGALCKALGWYFPLMAKLGVRSVEDLLFRKYPYVCPYCRKLPHDEMSCKLIKGTDATVDHEKLRLAYAQNIKSKPVDLDGWQAMFASIYPRQLADVLTGRSAVGLFEELGELAEAVRVFDRFPKYLAGEAADVFSYLMGLATEYSLSEQADGRDAFSFQREYIRRYPGLCTQCGYPVCVCPPLPASTIGRMAKELDVEANEELFGGTWDDLSLRSAHVADRALASLGGYARLLDGPGVFPFDRGEGNRSLVRLCLRVAEILGETDADVAASLRSAAIRAANNDAPAGSKGYSVEIAAVLDELKATPGAIEVLNAGPPLGFDDGQAGRLAQRWRVLVAFAGPVTEDPLQLDVELREISEAIKRSSQRDLIYLKSLHATRLQDLRRAFLDGSYDILFLSGHGAPQGPILENDSSESVVLEIDMLRDLLAHVGSVKCLVLNSCYTAQSIVEPLASVTVAMDKSVADDAALEFSKGFFDALGAGKDLDHCVDEGRLAAEMHLGKGSLPIVVLKDGSPALSDV